MKNIVYGVDGISNVDGCKYILAEYGPNEVSTESAWFREIDGELVLINTLPEKVSAYALYKHKCITTSPRVYIGKQVYMQPYKERMAYLHRLIKLLRDKANDQTDNTDLRRSLTDYRAACVDNEYVQETMLMDKYDVFYPESVVPESIQSRSIELMSAHVHRQPGTFIVEIADGDVYYAGIRKVMLEYAEVLESRCAPKVIFLDIDGVLNVRGDIDRAAVDNLNYITSVHSAAIVVTSSWRTMNNLEHILKEAGVDLSNGYDTIPVTINTLTSISRREAILDYIKEHRIKSYVILDDCNYYSGTELEPYAIITDESVGLNETDACSAIELFNQIIK